MPIQHGLFIFRRNYAIPSPCTFHLYSGFFFLYPLHLLFFRRKPSFLLSSNIHICICFLERGVCMCVNIHTPPPLRAVSRRPTCFHFRCFCIWMTKWEDVFFLYIYSFYFGRNSRGECFACVVQDENSDEFERGREKKVRRINNKKTPTEILLDEKICKGNSKWKEKENITFRNQDILMQPLHSR